MHSICYFVWQACLDHLSHYSDIKIKSVTRRQFIDAFNIKGGDFAFQFDNTSTHMMVSWNDIIHASQKIMVCGYPLIRSGPLRICFVK
jgi:hypothetical protein